MSLENLGWNLELAQAHEQGTYKKLAVGRVIRVDRGGLMLLTETGSLRGFAVGKLMEAEAAQRPVVGDWVVWTPMNDDEAVVVDMLPRGSSLSRVSAGETSQVQVLVANVDVALITTSLNADLNASRLERYLAMICEGGVQAVMVLTKSDLVEDPSSYLEQVQDLAPQVPVLAVSAETGQGMEALLQLLPAGTTAVLLGSSGVGKSTLINRLSGELGQRTGEVRQSDERGKHTTTARELILIPNGGVVIDTPGLRELLPIVGSEALNHTFPEIEQLAMGCRFRDCTHNEEPGCAIQHAIELGELDPRRLANFLKLSRETAHAQFRASERQNWQAHRKYRSLNKMYKQAQNMKDKMVGR